MKKIGIFMLVAGFLWASIMSVLDTRVITSWAGYVAAVLTASVGVALIRIHALRLTSAEGALAASLQALHQSMERAVANITKLNDEKADLYVYDIRHKIDELFPE
ncbi:MAG: hypothetical protein KAU50_02280, partial [Candidatus Marinimicrobia bacterium]|nr:hypothetical protein [Candidatus Neomarinimicrobiota bacterium]